jgi:hypothetical protein
MIHLPYTVDPADRFVSLGVIGQRGNVMTMTQAAALRVMWAEGGHLPCKHLHLELEHSNDSYLTCNYHCTACGESVAVTTHDPFQIV